MGAVQAQLIVNAPPPVTVSAPDTTALVASYTRDILPLSNFTITDASGYVDANGLWTKAKDYCATVEAAFRDAKNYAHKAHKAITTLEAQLLAPAKQIADHMCMEILRWQRQQETLRLQEEARLRAIEDARIVQERRLAQDEADRETARREAERAALAEDLAPWEIEDAQAVIAQPVLPVYIPAPTPIRLTSTVPIIMAGPVIVKKPWAARLVSLKALVQAAAKDDTLLEYLVLDQTFANNKARQLGEYLSKTVPGVEAYQESALKRA